MNTKFNLLTLLILCIPIVFVILCLTFYINFEQGVEVLVTPKRNSFSFFVNSEYTYFLKNLNIFLHYAGSKFPVSYLQSSVKEKDVIEVFLDLTGDTSSLPHKPFVAFLSVSQKNILYYFFEVIREYATWQRLTMW